jgi:hypothetical protein
MKDVGAGGEETKAGQKVSTLKKKIDCSTCSLHIRVLVTLFSTNAFIDEICRSVEDECEDECYLLNVHCSVRKSR